MNETQLDELLGWLNEFDHMVKYRFNKSEYNNGISAGLNMARVLVEMYFDQARESANL